MSTRLVEECPEVKKYLAKEKRKQHQKDSSIERLFMDAPFLGIIFIIVSLPFSIGRFIYQKIAK